MRLAIGFILLMLLGTARGAVAVAPADCPPDPGATAMLPLALGLGGRPGVPPGVTGWAYVGVPYNPNGTAVCDPTPPPPPRDILGGEPGNVLQGPPSPDLLRGPGTPRVTVMPP
jgi:hypothetical protein